MKFETHAISVTNFALDTAAMRRQRCVSRAHYVTKSSRREISRLLHVSLIAITRAPSQRSRGSDAMDHFWPVLSGSVLRYIEEL